MIWWATSPQKIQNNSNAHQLQIEKSYEEDEDDMPDDYEESDEDEDDAPDLLAAREDFEAVMDDFLENYELVGRRMRPVLPGDTAAEKLDTIRRALGEIRINPGAEDEDDEDIPMPHDIDDKKDRWDCETILSALCVRCILYQRA